MNEGSKWGDPRAQACPLRSASRRQETRQGRAETRAFQGNRSPAVITAHLSITPRQDCNYHITLIAECLLAMPSPHQSCYYCALMTR